MDEIATRTLPDCIKRAMQRYFDNRVTQSWQGQHILHSKPFSSQTLDLSSNDYLSISRHPKLIAAEIAALQDYGNGQMQSSVFLQENSLLRQTEQLFAQFFHYPDCLLLQSGWCANISLIQALAEPNTPVYLDFFSHMSFWEGAKIAQAKVIPFQHNSTQSLHKRLQRYGPGIIAVDSVYSTTGDISPLHDYVKLAREFECLLVVDESHSLGTHGCLGQGLVHDLNLQIDVITASLAKAFSGRGGVIAADKSLIELIRYTAFPSIFSSTLLPHDLAGYRAALSIISQESWRRDRLHANAGYLRQALREAGLDIGECASQIIPLIAGNEQNTIWLRQQLEQYDIHGAVFCAPATPQQRAMIRLSINTSHDQAKLSRVVDCLVQARQQRLNLPLFCRLGRDPT